MDRNTSEPDRNFGYVCKKHAPKPNPIYTTVKPDEFIGKYVKLGFDTGLPEGLPQLEHMWVFVLALAPPETDCQLMGNLNNDPQWIPGLKDGARVLFTLNEIEDVVA